MQLVSNRATQQHSEVIEVVAKAKTAGSRVRSLFPISDQPK